MSNIILAGSASGAGTMTVQAPITSSNRVLTLEDANGTLSPLILGTAQTASSSSVDFTGIPSWVKRITVMINGVSTTGTSGVIARLIVDGTPVTSGYVGASDHIISGLAPAAHTTGFGLSDVTTAATYVMNGCLTFNKFSATSWNGSFVGSSIAAGIVLGAGYVPISGTVTGIRITTLGGTDTFDAGAINIMYE